VREGETRFGALPSGTDADVEVRRQARHEGKSEAKARRIGAGTQTAAVVDDAHDETVVTALGDDEQCARRPADEGVHDSVREGLGSRQRDTGPGRDVDAMAVGERDDAGAQQTDTGGIGVRLLLPATIRSGGQLRGR
jgi:hypothetical protein